MSGPIACVPGLRRPIVKCPRDGWYLETGAQLILSRQWTDYGDGAAPVACRYCGALSPWELEQRPSSELACACGVIVTMANVGDGSTPGDPWCKSCWDSLWGQAPRPEAQP